MAFTFFKIKIAHIFLACLVLICFSCKNDDEDDDLSRIYYEVLQMEVDGALWGPSGVSVSLGGIVGYPFEVRYRKGFLSVYATSYLHNVTLLNMSARDPSAGENLSVRNLSVDNDQFAGNCQELEMDTLQAHYIYIQSVDTTTRTIKVDFAFDAVNECGDTTKIRNGRLRSQYRHP